MRNFLKTFTLVMILGVISCACTNKASVHSLSVQKLNQKASQYMQQNKPERAIETLEAIVDLDPNYPEAYYNLGVAYHETGKYPESISSLEKAIKIKKDLAPAYYTLGIDYEESASKIIDTKKSPSNEEKTQIAEALTKSIDAYSQYLTLTPNAEDGSQVKSKIEYLNNSLNRYSTQTSN